MLSETLALSKHMHLFLVLHVAVYFAPYVTDDSLCFQAAAAAAWEPVQAYLSRTTTYLLCAFWCQTNAPARSLAGVESSTHITDAAHLLMHIMLPVLTYGDVANEASNHVITETRRTSTRRKGHPSLCTYFAFKVIWCSFLYTVWAESAWKEHILLSKIKYNLWIVFIDKPLQSSALAELSYRWEPGGSFSFLYWAWRTPETMAAAHFGLLLLNEGEQL